MAGRHRLTFAFGGPCALALIAWLRRGYARLAAGYYRGDLLDGPPDKRPWMRWATYDRRCERLVPVADVVARDFEHAAGRLIRAGW